ncbi:YciI family protein [Granulicella sp. S190]|uniref:YciI family protein n=1 Tax=Granulicella sp. S190 TaxID=1747226 RepID=UPI00131C91A2|nr:YciI family protein [Granulicella sp. S190]
MKFVNLCRYIDDLNRVAELRPAHRQYMARLDSENKLWAAGPYEDGTGALFIYEAVDLEAAEEIRQADPYFTGDVLASSELAAWSPALYNASVIDASP